MLWKYGLLALFAPLASARRPDGRLHANFMPRPTIPMEPYVDNGPIFSVNGTELPPITTTYYFDQLIDHSNPSLGTFQQRFWFSAEFYKPGGPIILMTPGETNAEGYYAYLTNQTVNGIIAQQENGAGIILEHRFFGLSNPYPDLSVKSLKYLNIQLAIDDLVYFAENVNLPMPGGDQVTPTQAPWVLIGGSYPGALTSWTMVNKPGVFWAGYSSSGVVQAILNFWQYFEPAREHMPKNCSADVEAVITHIDQVLSGSDTKAIEDIKANWGLTGMTHVDDVAGALRNNLWDWQSLQPTSGPGNSFTKFCDALEVKDGKSAGPEGWGLDHAMAAWGAYWRGGYLKTLCTDPENPSPEDCLGTYNTSQPIWTDTKVDNANRSWMWFVCTEVGWLQNGAPANHPTLVTRLTPSTYDMRQCKQMFPEAFTQLHDPTIENTNIVYKGWEAKIDRIFFANGHRDPWRDATMSAEGTDNTNTPLQQIHIADGFHCSDLRVRSAIDPTIAELQKAALAAFHTWIADFKPSNKTAPSRPVAGLWSDESFVDNTSHVIPKPLNARPTL